MSSRHNCAAISARCVSIPPSSAYNSTPAPTLPLELPLPLVLPLVLPLLLPLPIELTVPELLPPLLVPAPTHAPEATQAPASEPDWWCGLSAKDNAMDEDESGWTDEADDRGSGLEDEEVSADDECASDRDGAMFECGNEIVSPAAAERRAALRAAALAPGPPTNADEEDKEDDDEAAEVDSDSGASTRACAAAAFSCTNCTNRSTDAVNPTPTVRANPANGRR